LSQALSHSSIKKVDCPQTPKRKQLKFRNDLEPLEYINAYQDIIQIQQRRKLA
jgi:hypothetical protein